MRHGALTAATRVDELIARGQEGWDVIWASDMLDLATFRGLCPTVADLPTVLYFHENQVTYPERTGDGSGSGRDAHYAYTNFLSALAADRFWFNSAFHRDDWLGALPSFLRRFPDHRHLDRIDELAESAEVQSPGVSAGGMEDARDGTKQTFDVVWAARWEHDKAPDIFFDALRIWRDAQPGAWRSSDLRVRLHVLGQSYGQVPDCFDAGRRDFEDHIETWGFVERSRYRRCLSEATVFVSTAEHEFFGISAVEAMAAGAHPLLPRRLSYPELVQDDVSALYAASPSATEELARHLADRYQDAAIGNLPPREHWSSLVARYRWSRRVPALDDALERVYRSL